MVWMDIYMSEKAQNIQNILGRRERPLQTQDHSLEISDSSSLCFVLLEALKLK
jgi:hypothetical protein